MFTCCRKSNEEALKERRRVSVLCNMMEPSLLQFYISRQWLNKFKTFAEPGPISNTDFLCSHGGMCAVIIKRFDFHRYQVSATLLFYGYCHGLSFLLLHFPNVFLHHPSPVFCIFLLPACSSFEFGQRSKY